jgi:hypothetical protein
MPLRYAVRTGTGAVTRYYPAELIAFPERNYGSTILVSIFRAGKMGNAN